MKVNLLDAIDIFGNGGYIDLHNCLKYGIIK